MGDVNLEIKLHNLDIRVEDLEQGGGGGGESYITSVSDDFRVYAKKLNLTTDNKNKIAAIDTKITKPENATDRQVLTYDVDTDSWIAEDSQGGSSYITSVTSNFTVTNNELDLSSDNKNKIAAIDTKITKPDTAANDQVLTYDNGNWIAKDSSGGSSYITSVTDKFNVTSGELDLSDSVLDSVVHTETINTTGDVTFTVYGLEDEAYYDLYFKSSHGELVYLKSVYTYNSGGITVANYTINVPEDVTNVIVKIIKRGLIN